MIFHISPCIDWYHHTISMECNAIIYGKLITIVQVGRDFRWRNTSCSWLSIHDSSTQLTRLLSFAVSYMRRLLFASENGMLSVMHSQVISSSSIRLDSYSGRYDLLKASAIRICFPGFHTTLNWYGCNFSLIFCILMGAWFSDFIKMASKGLWSASNVTSACPYIMDLNLSILSTMDNVFSICVYL